MTAPVSTPPSECTSTEITRFNALKHGILSRYTVLPWEDADEYQALGAALTAEHTPQGPTEEHLVEELAGILWRKRRLRMAEGALYHRGLKDTLEPFRKTTEAALVHLDAGKQIAHTVDAIQATPEDTRRNLEDLGEDQAMTEKALNLLKAEKHGTYETALAPLHPDTRQAWEDQLEWDSDDYDEDQKPYMPDTDSLRRYLESEIVPWYATRRTELENRPLIRAQALGEALDADKLARLARYEVHLDRKLERMLAMLIRLQDLRVGSVDD